MAPEEVNMSPFVPPEDAPTLAERQPHLLWAQSFHTRHKALPHPALQRQQKCTVWPLLEAGGSNPKGFQRIIEGLSFSLNTCGFYAPLRIRLQCSPSPLASIFK